MATNLTLMQQFLTLFYHILAKWHSFAHSALCIVYITIISQIIFVAKCDLTENMKQFRKVEMTDCYSVEILIKDFKNIWNETALLLCKSHFLELKREWIEERDTILLLWVILYF